MVFSLTRQAADVDFFTASERHDITLFPNVLQEARMMRIMSSEGAMTLLKVLCCSANVFALSVTQKQPHEGSRFIEKIKVRHLCRSLRLSSPQLCAPNLQQLCLKSGGCVGS